MDGQEASGRGLFDGFEGYRTPTREDHQRVLTEGLVVLDANVLLNLYRYTEQARDDVLSVLERLEDRLWIPHQVVVEFWLNREGVLRDPRDTEKAACEMSAVKDRAVSTFRGWANRVSLRDEESTALTAKLVAGFDEVINRIDDFSDHSAAETARNTEADAVLKRLEPILDGRVGPPLNGDEHQRAVAEGCRRVEQREPPGYLDKGKDDAGAAGDYLVWEQVLQEAGRRGCDVVFVTGDVKEDWWRRESGEHRGPRLELVNELRARAGVHLFMLRPTNLLSLGREVLSVTVQDESVALAEHVDRLVAEAEATLLEGGWNVAAIDALLAALEEEAPVQREVIGWAAKHDGFIDRDKVYELGEYPSDRSLRGFTRPINRIAQSYRDEGTLPEEALDVLDAVYSASAENPSMAIGFAVPRGVLSLVHDGVTKRDGSASNDES